MRYLMLTFTLALALAACGEEPDTAPIAHQTLPTAPLDAPSDAPDEAPDAPDEAPDAPLDAPEDAPIDDAPDVADEPADEPMDAADEVSDTPPDPSCRCRAADGPCCDGCMFKRAGTVCARDWIRASCIPQTSTDPMRVRWDEGHLACSGRDSACTPEVADFVSNMGGRRACGFEPVYQCTPGEGVGYEACTVAP